MGNVAAAGSASGTHNERLFFSSMAIVMVALVAIGFAPTFYLRWLGGNPIRSPFDDPGLLGTAYFIFHGLVFSSWMLLYLMQTLLIGRGQLATHRWLGRSAAIVAPLLVATGLGAALYAARWGFHDVPIPTATFLAVPLFSMILFGSFVWLGWRRRFDGAAHKRFMLLATLSLLGAATARIIPLRAFWPPEVDISILLLIPLILYDLVSLKRLHKVTLWGGLVFLVVTLGAVPIGFSPPWLALVGLIAA